MKKRLVKAVANLSIRRKFGLVLAIAFAAIVTIYGAITFLTIAQFRQALVSDVETLAQLMGNGSQVSLEFGEPTTANEYLKALELRENIISAAVYRADNTRFASYLKKGTAVDPLPDTLETIPSIQWEHDLLKLYREISHKGEKLGGVYLVSNLDALDLKLKEFLQVSGAIGLLTALLAIYLSSKLQELISEPLTQLSEVSKQVSLKKDYSLRASTPFESTDEVGILASNFNLMLGEIQDRDKKLRTAMESAEAATKAKSEFLANMSHEIRTPLNNILGSLEMAFDHDPNLSAPVTKCINMAMASSETLLTVINDILDFSKIEAGKLVIDPVRFDIREYINQITLPMLVRSEKKGVTTSIEFAQDVPQFFISDKTRIAQVLINLLGNAIKFTEQGDKLGIKVSLSTETRDLDSAIRFEIWDTGIGIPKDKQNEIFQSFSQADASTTRKYGGTGLGLTIANQLANLLGGTMWVESEEGVGSSFFFTIPNYQEPTALEKKPIAQTAKQYSASLEKPQALSILVVDDNAMGREIAMHRLQKLGHAVSLATNGLEAVEQWQQGNFDLILMDCQMPVMDGLEATRRIRELEILKTTRTAILAMTANAMDGQSQLCIEAGMDGYVSKPVVEREFYASIGKLLDRAKITERTA